MIHFDISNLNNELKDLQSKTNDPEFWQNTNESTPVLSRIKTVQNKINKYNRIVEELSNLKELNDFLTMEYEEEMTNELEKSLESIEQDIEKLEIETLLSGKYDKNNECILNGRQVMDMI